VKVLNVWQSDDFHGFFVIEAQEDHCPETVQTFLLFQPGFFSMTLSEKGRSSSSRA
jgi:hypothetical protein